MGEAADVMRRTMAAFNAQAARGLLGRKMKYLFVALMLAGVAVIAAPAHAADTAVCVVSHPLMLSPGLTLAPGQHGYTNHSIGSINCLGSLNGHQIVAPGSITEDGNLFGNCVQGTGSGTVRLSIPIAGRINFLSLKSTPSSTLALWGPSPGRCSPEHLNSCRRAGTACSPR